MEAKWLFNCPCLKPNKSLADRQSSYVSDLACDCFWGGTHYFSAGKQLIWSRLNAGVVVSGQKSGKSS